ncbi:MAG: fatty acyl-AMP ligase [Deltaproteobacteria bacterium]|nr:fatty acyl-AMP ligase [Deltaproteobacteria bacterium]
MRLRPLPYKTLPDALAAAADAGAALTLLEWDDPDAGTPTSTRRVPYAELMDRARRAATELRAAGVMRGTYVLMVLPNGLDFVITFFAVLLAGGVPVPQPYPAPFDDPDALLWNFERILERTRGGLLVLSEPLMERWAAEPRLGPLARTGAPPARAEPLAEVAVLAPEDVAFVQFTSGSTGHPKGVMLTHHNLLSNCAAIGMGLHMQRGEVGVSWLPLCHDMGLIGAWLATMCHHMDLVLMSPFDFVVDPLRWPWALSQFRGAISTSPNFGYALCVRARRSAVDAATLDLSSWRAALCGAEPVSADTLQRFAERFRGHGFNAHALLPVFGLAEASLAVTFPKPGVPLHVDHVDRNALSDARRAIPSPPGMPWSVGLTALGTHVAGHRVRVVDEHDRPRAEREVGEICVRGPSVTPGYLNDTAATQDLLRGGWMHTGDLGYVVDGQLYVCGRSKDVIIFRGRKYYPQDLERAAQDVEGVRKGNVVAFSDMDPGGGVERVTLVLESRADGEDKAALPGRVRARVSECTGVPVERVVVLSPGELPKTPSGKLRRLECRARFLPPHAREPGSQL